MLRPAKKRRTILASRHRVVELVNECGEDEDQNTKALHWSSLRRLNAGQASARRLGDRHQRQNAAPDCVMIGKLLPKCIFEMEFQKVTRGLAAG